VYLVERLLHERGLRVRGRLDVPDAGAGVLRVRVRPERPLKFRPGQHVALRVRGTARVILLAAAAAVIYGTLDALTKSTVDMLPLRGWGVLATWEPYGLLIAGILGSLFGQSAFNAGPLSLSLPVVDTIEPATAVILAVAVFQESLARTPAILAVQLLGAAAAATGIVLLSHSSVVLAENRRETAPAKTDANTET